MSTTSASTAPEGIADHRQSERTIRRGYRHILFARLIQIVLVGVCALPLLAFVLLEITSRLSSVGGLAGLANIRVFAVLVVAAVLLAAALWMLVRVTEAWRKDALREVAEAAVYCRDQPLLEKVAQSSNPTLKAAAALNPFTPTLALMDLFEANLRVTEVRLSATLAQRLKGIGTVERVVAGRASVPMRVAVAWNPACPDGLVELCCRQDPKLAPSIHEVRSRYIDFDPCDFS